MFPASIFDDWTPHARVATAVAPFVIASVLRIALGKNRLTRALISMSTVWFTINVLMAPYSAHMRQDLMNVGSMFR